ncbi:MAG: hypothetical protein IT374_02300 [Polyangiaceae bacterium]|nr:hypothetical protein [Polyangiaceae bacterium]
MSFRSVMNAVESLRGAGARERCVGAMAPEIGDPLRYGQIVAGGWYPIGWYKAMWQGVLAGAQGGPELVRQVAHECMRQDTAGVYRLVMRLVSPETVFAGASRFFSTYYDTGTLQVRHRDTGFARAEWTGCAGFDRTMWQEVVASGEALVEFAGGKHVRHRILSGGRDGDVDTVSEVHWV